MPSTYLVELHGTHECVVFFNQTFTTMARHLTTVGRGVARLTRVATYEAMPDPRLPAWAFKVEYVGPTATSYITFSDEPELEVALAEVLEDRFGGPALPQRPHTSAPFTITPHPVVGVCPGVEFEIKRAAPPRPRLTLVANANAPDADANAPDVDHGGCDCAEPCEDCGQSGPRPDCSAECGIVHGLGAARAWTTHGPEAHENSDLITVKADTILWVELEHA